MNFIRNKFHRKISKFQTIQSRTKLRIATIHQIAFGIVVK